MENLYKKTTKLKENLLISFNELKKIKIIPINYISYIMKINTIIWKRNKFRKKNYENYMKNKMEETYFKKYENQFVWWRVWRENCANIYENLAELAIELLNKKFPQNFWTKFGLSIDI